MGSDKDGGVNVNLDSDVNAKPDRVHSCTLA